MLNKQTSATELLQFSGGQPHWQSALRSPQETRLVFIGIAGKRFSDFEQAVRGSLK